MSSVSVLIPVYNDPDGLFKTLKSLDSFDAGIVLVVDDGSDEKIDYVQEFNFNLKILRLDKNMGIESALNKGLDYLLKFGSKYIARLDSGDIVKADRFNLQSRYLNENPGISVVGSYVDVVDSSGSFLYQQKYPLLHDDIFRLFKYQNQMCHPAVMFRASIFREGIRYPLDRPAAEDYALFFHLSHKYKMANIPVSLLDYEVSASSISSVNRRLQCFSRLKVQLDNASWLNIDFYAGVIRTLLLIMLPRGLSVCIKQFTSKVRY